VGGGRWGGGQGGGGGGGEGRRAQLKDKNQQREKTKKKKKTENHTPNKKVRISGLGLTQTGFDQKMGHHNGVKGVENAGAGGEEGLVCLGGGC